MPINAVKLAAKYGIRELSNYILYNFQDKPEDLYERLRINADLCKELNVAIFSFPMKYIPLFGEEAKHRAFTGKYWNKKFVRAIQSILNVTKGIVAPSNLNEKTSFFEEAFGKNLNEFFEILYMPETYIIYRHLFRYDFKYTTIWETEYRNLSEFDRKSAQNVIQKNLFTPEELANYELSNAVKHFLRHYTIQRGSIERGDEEFRKLRTKFDGLIKNEPFTDLLTIEASPQKVEDVHHKKLKTKFDTLIKEDPFIDLTLTYDFENEVLLQD